MNELKMIWLKFGVFAKVYALAFPLNFLLGMIWFFINFPDLDKILLFLAMNLIGTLYYLILFMALPYCISVFLLAFLNIQTKAKIITVVILSATLYSLYFFTTGSLSNPSSTDFFATISPAISILISYILIIAFTRKRNAQLSI